MSIPFPRHPVLIIDDEEHILNSMNLTLNMAGVSNVVLCKDSREVEQLFEKQRFAAATLDLNMPYISGRALLPLLVERHPEVPIIVITGANDHEIAQESIDMGAFDYLVKPVDKLRLNLTIGHAISRWQNHLELKSVHHRVTKLEIEHPEAFSGLTGDTPQMLAALLYAEALAPLDSPLLIQGDRTREAEKLARAIHELSGRRGPFVTATSSTAEGPAPAETVFFDGKDLFREAEEGTVFVDDVSNLDTGTQAALALLIKNRKYSPAGSSVFRRSSVRLILGTSVDLQTSVEQGRFRKELLHLLSCRTVVLKPLEG